MLLARLTPSIFAAALMAAGVASGQDPSTGSGPAFPSKPIRMVTGGVGGSSDFASRLIAQGLTGNLGQQVIVDSRSAGVIPGQIVSRASPDGYTVLLHGSSVWLSQFLQDNVPYDPVRDFSPITIAATSPLIVVVNPALAAKSVKELIALAKAKPGALNYASSGAASSNRLAAELFNSLAGVNIVRINYKGVGLALSDVVSGEVQMTIGATGGTMPHIKSGRLRALAVTSAQPSALAPGLPTVAATGLPGYEYSQMLCVFAPTGTPAATVNRLNQEIARVLKQPDVRERFLNGGVESVGGPPQQLAAAMKSDMVKLGKVIKDVGIRGD